MSEDYKPIDHDAMYYLITCIKVRASLQGRIVRV
jgi:hypothetical protein